jgi:nitrite reductase/ring-hydroxylating ferredoxin subunit
MTDPGERISAFVEALRKGQRPPRFPVESDDADVLRAAVALAAGRPGHGAPSSRFVSQLHHRLAEASGQAGEASSSRRRFLGRLGLPAVAALLGAAAATGLRAASDHWLPDTDADDQLVPAGQGAWIPVAPFGDLVAGQPRQFTAGPINAFVVRDPQTDDVYAVSAICTHLGCMLNANAAAGRLDCPCHGASFTLAGDPLSPIYPRALPRLRARINGDTVEVYAPTGVAADET